MGRTRVGWVLALVVVITTACSDGRDPQTGAAVPAGGTMSTPTTGTSTPTTAAVESYEVPEVIDQAYVQRVVSAYDKVLGDAIRVLKRDGAVTEDFLSHLLAIYTEPEFETHQRAWLEEVAQGRVEKSADVVRNPVTSVLRFESTDSACLIVRATRDYSPTLRSDVDQVPTANDQYLVLVRKRDGRDPMTLNRTPWVIAFDGSKSDNTVPRNSCGD